MMAERGQLQGKSFLFNPREEGRSKLPVDRRDIRWSQKFWFRNWKRGLDGRGHVGSLHQEAKPHK